MSIIDEHLTSCKHTTYLYKAVHKHKYGTDVFLFLSPEYNLQDWYTSRSSIIRYLDIDYDSDNEDEDFYIENVDIVSLPNYKVYNKEKNSVMKRVGIQFTVGLTKENPVTGDIKTTLSIEEKRDLVYDCLQQLGVDLHLICIHEEYIGDLFAVISNTDVDPYDIEHQYGAHNDLATHDFWMRIHIEKPEQIRVFSKKELSNNENKQVDVLEEVGKLFQSHDKEKITKLYEMILQYTHQSVLSLCKNTEGEYA